VAKRGRQEERFGLSMASDCYIVDAIVLGGFGTFGEFEINLGDRVSLRFTADEMRIRLDEYEDEPVLPVPFDDVYEIEIGGPGVVTTGGGFIGGGFGLEGAAEGMAIASVLNALTTRTSIQTLVRVDTSHGEVFLMSSTVAPQAMRIALSPAIWRLADRSRARESRH
jgi:hypothetical protein